jgi:excinuclease UvrABC nuclease subunit
LQGVEWETIAGALPKLRAKLARLGRDLRFEDAARLRDRIEALEAVARELAYVERLRRLEVCILAPAAEEGWRRAFFVAKGQVVCSRRYSPLEVQSALTRVERAEPTLAPEAADELLVIGQFLRRPPPELEVVPLAHLRRWTTSASERAA